MTDTYSIPINDETVWTSPPPNLKRMEVIATYILQHHYLPCLAPQNTEAARNLYNSLMFNTLRDKLVETIRKHNGLGNAGELPVGHTTIQIPTWEEFLTYLPDIPTHETGKTTVNIQPASEIYRLDGTYEGQRTDGKNGIWVDSDHLRNLDGSLMKKDEFKYIAGTVRAEASTHGAPLGSRTSIDTDALWQEAAAIYSVLRNRVKYSLEKYGKITTVIDRIDDSDGAEGRTRISEMTDIHTVGPGSRTALVVSGIITTIRDGKDYSQDSYFWDGEDIRRNEHNSLWGFCYSDVKHDIYGTGDIRRKHRNKNRPGRHITDTHTKLSVEEVDHTLDSVTAIGGTIFWKYCKSYMDLMGQSKYNYKDKK